MYLRAAHAELDVALLRKFIVDNPLGILFTALQSPNFPTLQCTHIPWVLDGPADDTSASASAAAADTTKLGTLRGHMARPNPHAKAIVEAVRASNGTLEEDVSVLFNGPVQHYVTPKFYVKTKPATGKVVPTWNYSAVQVYGRARVLCDATSDDTASFLQRQVRDLTRLAEEGIMGYTGGERPGAWEVGDAPAGYVDVLRRNIVGVEIEILRLEGKWKMSQEMGSEDRLGVVEGFERLATEEGRRMAQTVEDRGVLKDARAASKSKS